ncbi:MAG: helix-turn-helix domain-containing protein [Sulfuritalea sp.]|nr:helix-turn-helix domain-containing protein [Sulfuritalea sp.]
MTVPTEEYPLLLTLEEAGKCLGGVSKSTVRRLIERGELASCRVGLRLLRIPASSIRAYVQRTAVGGYGFACETPVGVSKSVVVVAQEADNLTRAESVACEESSTWHTDVKIRRIGGSNTPTQTAKQLTKLLEQLTARKRKPSKQSGVLKSISSGSGASSLNTLSTS